MRVDRAQFGVPKGNPLAHKKETIGPVDHSRTRVLASLGSVVRTIILIFSPFPFFFLLLSLFLSAVQLGRVSTRASHSSQLANGGGGEEPRKPRNVLGRILRPSAGACACACACAGGDIQQADP